MIQAISKKYLIIGGITTLLILIAWFVIPKSQLTLKIEPTPFRIIIDGKTQTTQTNSTIRLAEGEHTYFIEAEGYRPASGKITTKNFSDADLNVQLKKLTTIEKQYKQLLVDFPGMEVMTEAEPEPGWLVVELSRANDKLYTQIGIYNRQGTEWNLVVRGSTIFSSAELTGVPSSVQDWLFANGYIMNDEDELGN